MSHQYRPLQYANLDIDNVPNHSNKSNQTLAYRYVDVLKLCRMILLNNKQQYVSKSMSKQINKKIHLINTLTLDHWIYLQSFVFNSFDDKGGSVILA